MPKWSDFGGIWTTLRELDVNVIREEAERPLAITCIGHDAALDQIDRLLHQGHERYPLTEASPLQLLPLARAAEHAANLSAIDLLVFAIDTRAPLSQAELDSFGRLESLATPFLLVLLYGEQPRGSTAFLSPALRARAIVVADPTANDAADRLATVLLSRLPSELHLAAARRLPGIRAVFARELIGSVAFTNASYSLASGLPEQIPIVSIPFAAADILVLTKNQAMLVYRLALAYGAPPDFQARMREVLPVVGGAFLWRQAARSLIGLVPIWGLLPKIAVAYAGTYTTGIAAWRWYESGDLVSTDQLKRISNEAITLGRKRAAEILARARSRNEGSANGPSAKLRLFDRVRQWLPFGRKPAKLPPPKT